MTDWPLAELAASVAALVVIYLVGVAYRRSLWIYGAPRLRPPSRTRPQGYREPATAELNAYHIAYLNHPAGHPGMVALIPLLAEGVVEIFEYQRAIRGKHRQDLDRHQQAAFEQAEGVEFNPLERALSVQMADELTAELQGTRMQCPEGGRGLPRTATRSLWLATLGACALIIGVGGVWGWLSVFAVNVAYRATRQRGFAPDISMSESGWWATRQLEWDLDQRFKSTQPEAYSRADIALYLAIKPLPYGRVPKLDHHWVHVLGPSSSPQLDTNLGPRLSSAELDAARRTNQRRKLLVSSLGIGALGVGVATSIMFGFAEAPWIYVFNAVLCGATMLFDRWRLRLREDCNYIRDSKAFLPKGAK